MGFLRNCLWADAYCCNQHMYREQLSCVCYWAAQLMAVVQKQHRGRHSSEMPQIPVSAPAVGTLEEDHASPGEQEDLSPLQLSAKEQQISKLNNEPPELGFFSSRVLEECETGTAQLTAVWISLCKSTLMAEKWKLADIAEPFKRLQR